jgi:hypothetical protein
MRFATSVLVTAGALAGALSVQLIADTPLAHAGDTPDLSEAAAGAARGPAAAPSSPVPAIVLYTMGKGDVVWEKFGHAALCVEYEPGIRLQSRCYNYGTTDFSAPVSVGWGFLRGEGLFWVSATTPAQMVRRYIGFDRTLWKQVLPLDDDAARAIVARLDHDFLPENRYYTYHHFYDNCTTRIRDIIDEGTGGKLRIGAASTPGPSFRDFSRQGFAEDTWLLLLTDYLLGRGADVRPDLWQAMFLPDYLREHVRERFGAEPVLVYQRRGRPFALDAGSGRGWLVLLALVLAAPLFASRLTGRFERAGVAMAAVPLFLITLIMWFLAVVTTVQEFRFNEALLMYWPTDIALPFWRPERRRRYARARLAVVAVVMLLGVAGVLSQPLWAPALVVVLPMAVLALPARPRGAR